MFLSLIGMEKTAADVLAEGLEKIAGPSSALNLLESGQSLKRMLLRAQMSPQYSRDVASALSSLGNPGRLTASLRQNHNGWRIMETLRRIKLRPNKEPSLIDSMMRNSGMPGVMDMIKVTSLQKTGEILGGNMRWLAKLRRMYPR